MPWDGVSAWLTPRRIAVGLWAGALLTSVVLVGFPVDRIRIALWTLAGVAAYNVPLGARRVVREVLLWSPLMVALLIYDQTRGLADALGVPVHAEEPLAVDLWLFGGTLPTVWLQEQFYVPAWITARDILVGLVYISHFVAIWAALGVLYVRSRHRWASLMRQVLLLSYLGLATYVLYPAAPPWMASNLGLVPEPIHRVSVRGLGAVGLDFAASLVEQGQSLVNEVAAVPSLHAAFSMLVTVALLPLATRVWQRALLIGYPLMMGFGLVYGGEHYVIDVLLGWTYVGFVLVAVGLGDRWWRNRRPAPPSTPPQAAASDGFRQEA